jgi:hypothetical protein
MRIASSTAHARCTPPALPDDRVHALWLGVDTRDLVPVRPSAAPKHVRDLHERLVDRYDGSLAARPTIFAMTAFGQTSWAIEQQDGSASNLFLFGRDGALLGNAAGYWIRRGDDVVPTTPRRWIPTRR